MSAVKTSGLGDNWYVGGVDLSTDTQQFGRVGGGPAVLDYTDITQSAHARVGSQRGGEMNWVSYFDKGAGQAHPTLSVLPRTDVIVSYFHQPTAIGSAAASMVSQQIGYDPTRAADGALTVAVAAQSNGYGIEWGQSLTVGKRTDTTATSPATGLDGGASSAFGAQAYLHVFAFTGTSVTVTLQDSADNSTFAAIASPMAFTAATGATFQRIAVTGTIRRYVRAITTGTFSNAVFVVNFVRNELTTSF